MFIDTYTTYLINADGAETMITESVWKVACTEAADKAIVGRVDCRAVVVRYNPNTLRDEVVYEVASKETEPSAPAAMKTFAVMPGRVAVKVRTGDAIETFEFKGSKRRADVKILQLISEGYTLDATHETMALAAD